MPFVLHCFIGLEQQPTEAAVSWKYHTISVDGRLEEIIHSQVDAHIQKHIKNIEMRNTVAVGAYCICMSGVSEQRISFYLPLVSAHRHSGDSTVLR